ncbi:MAG: rod shape-determining protein MreC [Jatrophihabitantaceae bacterium]
MRTLTRRQQLSATVLAVLALLFISLDFAGGSLGGARGGVTGALGSLYRGTDAVIGPVRRFVQGVPDVADNRRRLARLSQQNLDLQRRLAAAEADRATASRLAALQLQADAENWQILPARVIATSPGAGFQWTVTVDVGSRDRVLAGQTVTDGAGLVGRVVQVYRSSSVVLLAADPASGVGVRDSRSGQLLLASGRGGAGLSASPLGEQPDVRQGDVLLTGPAGKTTYAPGLRVGTVTSVHTGADGVLTAQLRPAAALRALDLVGIVLLPPRGTARAPLTPQAGR